MINCNFCFELASSNKSKYSARENTTPLDDLVLTDLCDLVWLKWYIIDKFSKFGALSIKEKRDGGLRRSQRATDRVSRLKRNGPRRKSRFLYIKLMLVVHVS